MRRDVMCIGAALVGAVGLSVSHTTEAYWPLLLFVVTCLMGMSLSGASRDSVKSLRASSVYGMVIIGLSTALNLINSSDDSHGKQDLATVLLVLSAYPMWRYLRLQEDGLPLVPMLGLTYGLEYALPVLLPFERLYIYRHTSEEAQIRALLLATGGWMAFLLTFYGLWPLVVRSLTAHPNAPTTRSWSEARAVQLACVLVALGLPVYSVTALRVMPSTLQAILGFIGQFSLLGIAILFYLQMTRRLSWHVRLLFWGFLLPVQILVDLSGGAVFPLVRTVSLLGLLHIYVKRQIPWRFVALAGAFLVLVLAAKQDFRRLTWGGPDDEDARNPLTTTFLYSDAVEGTDLLKRRDAAMLGLRKVVNRIDCQALFADVVYQTPEVVPYWGGTTYASLLWKFVPRFLYPDKPTESVGNEFGHRYGYLYKTDNTTSWNLPQLIEMYLNFGPLGVIIGMAVMGVVYQVLRQAVEFRQARPWGQLAAAVIYVQLSAESNFSVVFGNVAQWAVLFYILGRFAFPSRRSSPARSERGQGPIRETRARSSSPEPVKQS